MENEREKLIEYLKTILVADRCQISIKDKQNSKHKLYFAAFKLSDEEFRFLEPTLPILKNVLEKMAIEIDLVDYYNNKNTIRFQPTKTTLLGFSPQTFQSRLLLYHDTSNAASLKAVSIKYRINN